MQSEQLIQELPKGLIKWYPFQKGETTLLVTCGIATDKIMSEALSECGLLVDCISEDELISENYKLGNRYGYIVLVGVVERSRNPQELLHVLYSVLKASGRLLLGMDNRLGVRYFCGDRDAFTNRNFDGIENYARVSTANKDEFTGRAYSRAEIIRMLEAGGFIQHRFYSIMPELNRPQALYAEDYLPEEELDVRIMPQYYSPDTVFLEEEKLYKSLIDNGMFHVMANGYFVECSLNGEFSNAKQVTISMDRGREDALMTIIRRDEQVEKKAVYEEGIEKLTQLLKNTEDLKQHGVNVVDAKLDGASYIMPYIHGEIATDYFRKLLLSDKEKFLCEIDRLWKLILQSSEHVPYEEVDWERFDPLWERRKIDDPEKDKWKKMAFGTKEEQEKIGVILKRGYIDLVCLNCFYADGEFVFYDQEFYVENLPAKVILLRTIGLIYHGDARLEAIIPQRELEEKYGLYEHRVFWYRFEGKFLNQLRKEEELASYHQLWRRDMGVVNSNRQRMNYSQSEYERLFRDIFKGTEGRELYLFGSGNFTKKFLSQFAADYEITGILDNNPDKWGTELSGYKISSPEILRELPEGTYKVIICIKNYVQVMKQLQDMGVKEYSIYDSSLTYPRKAPAVVIKTDEKQTPKKYCTGYIAGVFDLFHIGHLNMFKRAKEQCEYLIVGVVNDESVMRNKKTMPYIPFEERIEMVRSCRYVDEAVEIPTDYPDTDEAYRRYQFDVQFSGSDYENDPIWLAKKTFLQKHGSDLVFFPYTQSTSSTKIKEKIRKDNA